MGIRNDIIKKKSGSAASKIVKWKWYELMQFLHDTQDSHRLVYSNIVYIIEYKIMKMYFTFLLTITTIIKKYKKL